MNMLNSYNLCMARMARVVVLNISHYITQRGVRRLDTFFDDEGHLEKTRHFAKLVLFTPSCVE